MKMEMQVSQQYIYSRKKKRGLIFPLKIYNTDNEHRKHE